MTRGHAVCAQQREGRAFRNLPERDRLLSTPTPNPPSVAYPNTPLPRDDCETLIVCPYIYSMLHFQRDSDCQRRAQNAWQARFVSHSHIHVTFGSKRSDGAEVCALESARSGTNGHGPCRCPLRPERAALALWARPVHASSMTMLESTYGRRPPYRRR